MKMVHTQQTLGELATAKVRALCSGFDLAHLTEPMIRRLAVIGRGWWDDALTDQPPFENDVTDDGSPFELSVALEGGRCQLRALAESRDRPYTLEASWSAGLDTSERMSREFGADTRGLEGLLELFAPTNVPVRFAMWHAFALDAAGNSLIKVYLNPQVRGPGQDVELVREAFSRLGRAPSFSAIEQKLRDHPGARLTYLSLDLAPRGDARLKVYLAYPDATVDDVERAMGDAEDIRPGDARAFIGDFVDHQGPFSERPLLVCHAVRDDGRSTATLHLPVRSYVMNDADVVRRARNTIAPQCGAALENALHGVSPRALAGGRGLVTYVSMRRVAAERRFTFYVAPELYAVRSPRQISLVHSGPVASAASALAEARPSMLIVQHEIVRAQAELRKHPFLQRLETQATDEGVDVMAAGFTFFALAFQDMLRLAATTMTHPLLRELASVHESEDRGHDRWFLHDVHKLRAVRSLRWTFSGDHRVTRDIAYALMTEILGASSDFQRFAVVLSLEAIAAEFFGRVIGLLERTGLVEGLRYFGHRHQEAEQSHDLFEDGAQENFLSLEIPQAVVPDVLGAVARCFRAMTRLADDLDERMANPARARSVA